MAKAAATVWDEFFRRFTDDEAKAVLASTDPTVKQWLDQFRNKSRAIQPKSGTWLQVAKKLVTANVLTQDRANVIFV